MAKVLRRMTYVRLGQAWAAWKGRVVESKEKATKVFRAASYIMKLQLTKAWNSWKAFLEWRHFKHNIVERCAGRLG